MKKILYFAAAATMMVSCAQNEKLSNDLLANQEPTVIGFNTISDKATRATEVESLEKYHKTMAVWSTKKSDNDVNALPEVVFCGDSVADLITYDSLRQAPNNWTYSPYRYWDKQATYDFVAVAPNANIVRYNKPENVADNEGTFVTTDTAGYVLVGQNLQTSEAPAESEIKIGFTGGTGKDTDLMTSGKINRKGANGSAGDVNLQFKHILAKLNISIAKDRTFDNVKVLVKSVKVTGLDDKGKYEESVSDDHSGWHSSVADSTYTLAWANPNGIELPKGSGNGENYQPGKALYFIESLIMPQTIEEQGEKLIIDYTIVSGANTQNYNYVLNLHDGENQVFDRFMERNNYSIILTIRPNVITFDASTEVWTEKTSKNSSQANGN